MKTLMRIIQSVIVSLALIFSATITSAQSVWSVPSGNWSAPGSWLPAAVPLVGTNVLFTNNVGAASAAGTVDNTVDLSFGGTIGLLQYANTNAGGAAGFYHTTQIAAGQTLTVTNGLIVGTAADSGGACVVNATITGAGGKLVLSGGTNLVVNQASATSGAHIAILNLAGLDTLTANGGRLQVGVANGVNRAEGNLFLAKTNTITLSGAAPQFYMGFNNGNNNGSANFPILELGQSNAFFVDSITISADKQGNPGVQAFCSIRFSPITILTPTSAAPAAVRVAFRHGSPEIMAARPPPAAAATAPMISVSGRSTRWWIR